MKIIQKALPHIVALVLFAVVSALFFAPQYSDKALRQGDMVQVGGMGQDIADHQQQYDEHPQWAGRMFGGMPAYLINMNYDGRWIKNVADNAYFLGQPASFLFIAMASFYLMLLMFGVNPWIGIIGGLAYGLSTYFPIIIEAGHITKMMALAWIPAIVGAVYYAYHKHRLLGAALAGIFLSIEISTSHPQITYYFAFVIFALFINEFVRAYKEKILRKFAFTTLALFGAAILAVGSNLVQLYYVASYSSDSNRGTSEIAVDAQHATSGLDKDYATAWSYGKAESFNMFIPNFMGGSSSGGFAEDGAVAQSLKPYDAADIATQLPGYFGTQTFTSGPVYLGAVMIFLMVFGLFVLSGRQKWWIVAVSVLALTLAWGRNFMWLTDLFLDHFPLYNKFRTVSMLLVVLEWSVPLLGILALQKLYDRNIASEKFNRALKLSLAITGGFALFSALILPQFMSFASQSDSVMGLPSDVVNAMWSERATLLRNDSFRSLIFVVISSGILWLYFKSKIRGVVMVAAFVGLTLADLYTVDRRFVKTEDFQPKKQALQIQPTAADIEILKDKSDYRVANFSVSTFQDATTSKFHRTIGGYHAAKLRRYQDVIDKHLMKNNMAVYNMLNTKYIITKDSVIVNPDASGSAWFVPNIEWVSNADAEIAALGSGFNAKHTAIVDERFKGSVTANVAQDSTAKIELTSYKVNNLTYKYTAAASGVVIFSEIYYPKGWTAYIDGVQAPYFRADYILRAMEVPAGDHTIEWRFAAPHFATIVAVTRASSAMLILLSIGCIVGITIKKRRNG